MKIINRLPNKKLLTKGYRKFQYSFIKVFLTIIAFPFVYYYSKKYQKLFFPFCFDYQREGSVLNKDGQVIDINSFAYHYDDWLIKNLIKYEYPINFDQENYQEFTIKNENNQSISCLRVVQKYLSTKWVIGFHGWTENKYLGLRLVTWFYQQGYNILTFDSFAHGKSYGQYNDVGLSSSKDVNCIIKWLKDNYQVSDIGLIGNSMGASTINYYLLNYANSSDISWAITDCGFTNLLVQFRFVMQYRYSRPWWLISNGIAKRYQKFTNTNIKNYNLLTKLKKGFSTPTLLIHGKGDTFVPFFMADIIHEKQINNSYNNYDYLFLDNIEHVATLVDAYEDYIEKIKNFISKYENKGN